MSGSLCASLVIACLATLSFPTAVGTTCEPGVSCRAAKSHRDHLLLQRRVVLKSAEHADCWGELSGLAVDEGAAAGGDLTTNPSAEECKAACSGNNACQSFSKCPEWNGCWMKRKSFSGNETTKQVGECKTFYKRACASPVPAPSPSVSTCWGEFSELAASEGDGVGGDLTNSPSTEDCKSACDDNPECHSFSSCPQYHSCWMKSNSFTGDEPTKKHGSCKTFFKRACNNSGEGGDSSVPAPTPATPDPTPSPAVSCWKSLPAIAVNEGSSAGGHLTNGPSIEQCKAACDDNAACHSFSSCPQWNGCWMKTQSFTGGEATKQEGECKTFYKTTSCEGASPGPSPPVSSGNKINVVSYNLFWWNAFGANPWKGAEVIKNIKNNLQPDILGVQECDDAWHVASQTGLKPASAFSGGQGTFVNPSLFSVGATGSQDIQATGKWGPRFATYAQLTHLASGRTFWHFNTHWCVHNCDANKRYGGAKNMLSLIHEKAGNPLRDPVVITGDFNMFQGYVNEISVQHFLQNGFSTANTKYVDAIFYSTAHWRVESKSIGWSAHSDHDPVLAELAF